MVNANLPRFKCTAIFLLVCGIPAMGSAQSLLELARKSPHITMDQITDEKRDTLMCGTVANQRSVPWTKPDDLRFDNSFFSKENAFVSGHFMFADGSVAFLPIEEDINKDRFRALCTISGGEPSGRDTLYPKGFKFTVTREGSTLEVVRQAKARMASSNALKEIAVGFHNFHAAFKYFPPATLYGPDGKPWHSWRVLILPFVGHNDLWDQYDATVPWDHPNNADVLRQMPDVYRDPLSNDPKDTRTRFLAISGPGTAFPLSLSVAPKSPRSQVEIIGLGDLPGGRFRSSAESISDDGLVVVGHGISARGLEAFRWKDGVLTGIGKSESANDGTDFMIARAVNSDGSRIVGFGTTVKSTEANRDRPEKSLFGEAIGWYRNRTRGLGDLPGGPYSSSADDISSDGSVVVGRSEVAERTNSKISNEAFRWEAGKLKSLGDTDGSGAEAVSSDGSVVVGWFKSPSEAFRWESGTLTGLGFLPGGTYSGAKGVSANGSVVVGYSSSSNGREAFLWKAGVMTSLGDLPGGQVISYANAVSANGSIVVGFGETDEGGEAFLWTSQTGMLRLADILTSQGADLSHWRRIEAAMDISADGSKIVGWGTNKDDNSEAFLAKIDLPNLFKLNSNLSPKP